VRSAEAAGVSVDDPSWLLIGLALSSPAQVALVPVQDVLSLGSEARMNTPGRERGNWRYRLEAGQLDAALAARLRALTRATGRAA
jgi:4-alpha-glucanotransferase